MEELFYDNNTRCIPVTIITGFLGSGKTTFLNHLLKKYNNTRFAIIENEFGELPIDSSLLANESTPVVELADGCICCTLNTDFYTSLIHIHEKHTQVDHLLVETTGVADPSQVIDLFLTNKHIQRLFNINSVICLADAPNITGILEKEPEAVKQLVLSDIVMLNKMDLLPANTIVTLRERVRRLNPMAEIMETSFAHTNGSPVLNTKAYSRHHIESTTLSLEQADIDHDICPLPQAQEGDNHRIQSEVFVLDECFDEELFKIWISSFVYFNQTNLYRVKGILFFRNDLRRKVFQAVNGSCIFEDGSTLENDQNQFSKIVFIGKEINREEITSNLCKFFTTRVN